MLYICNVCAFADNVTVSRLPSPPHPFSHSSSQHASRSSTSTFNIGRMLCYEFSLPSVLQATSRRTDNGSMLCPQSRTHLNIAYPTVRRHRVGRRYTWLCAVFIGCSEPCILKIGLRATLWNRGSQNSVGENTYFSSRELQNMYEASYIYVCEVSYMC